MVTVVEGKTDMASVYKNILGNVAGFGNSYFYKIADKLFISGSKNEDGRNDLPIINFTRYVGDAKHTDPEPWVIDAMIYNKIEKKLIEKNITGYEIKSEFSGNLKQYGVLQICRYNVIVTFNYGKISLPGYKDANNQAVAMTLLRVFDEVLNTV